MAATSTGYRAVRLALLTLHLLHGVVWLAMRAPHWTVKKREREFRRWSRRLLRIVGVRVDHEGQPPASGMVVMNHISWLDIFALNAVIPCRFVAKSEIANWPLIGPFCTRCGTLYIKRGSKRAARETNATVTACLLAGDRIAVFPEGTTSFGHSVLHFHAALLQPVVDSKVPAHPATLRYIDRRGAPTRTPSYVGDQSLIDSLWCLLSEKQTLAHITFGESVPTDGRHRREVADDLHEKISHGLHMAQRAKAAERASDPPGATR